MNTEYVWWFLILVAVGIGVVLYLALGPVPEIEAADRGEDDQGAPGDAPASSPLSTSLPGPAEPASTSDTP